MVSHHIQSAAHTKHPPPQIYTFMKQNEVGGGGGGVGVGNEATIYLPNWQDPAATS